MALVGQMSELAEAEQQVSRSISGLLTALEEDAPNPAAVAAQLAVVTSQLKYLQFLLTSDTKTTDEELNAFDVQHAQFTKQLSMLRDRFARLSPAVPSAEALASPHESADSLAAASSSAASSAASESSAPARPDAPNASSGLRQRGRPAQQQPATSRPDEAGASLHRTHGMLASEVERMGALGELLTADAASLGKAGEEHEGFAAEVEEAKARIRHIKTRNKQDSRAILLAFALFAIIAAYAMGSRLLWLVGIRVP